MSLFFLLATASAEPPPTQIVNVGVLREELGCFDHLLAHDKFGVCSIEMYSDTSMPTERVIQMSLESQSLLWATIETQSREIEALKAEIERLKAK